MSSFFDEASLVFIPSGYKTSKAYSIKPTDGSGDMSFSRSNDTATRVNSAGLIEKVRTNLALYSEQFDNASWSKGPLTVTANAGTAPNGTTTADLIYPSANSSNSVIFNGVTIANSTEYTNSIYVKASGKTWVFIRGINDGVGVWFDVANGVVGTTQSGVSGTITSVGSGWYRCSVTQTSSGTTGRLVVLVVDGDGSTAVTASGTNGLLIWGAQQETGVMTDYIATTSAAVSVGPVANVPRLDYLNSSCPRLLLEPQRTNLITYSEQFDNAAWTKQSSTISANQTASPSGYVDADKMTATANFSRLVQTHSLSATTSYTASFYVKDISAGSSIRFLAFDATNGVSLRDTNYSASITTTEWTRLNFTFTTTTAASVQIQFIRDLNVGEEIFIWGAQLEAGAYATSYIPTLGAAVTRGADAASKTGISSLIGQTEGTLFAEVNSFGKGESANRIFGVSDGTSNERVIMLTRSTGFRFIVTNGGTSSVDYTYAINTDGFHKLAITYSASGASFFVDGQKVGDDASIVLPSSLNSVFVGVAEQTGVNTNNFGGSVGQAIIFPTALSDADLAALTA